ncbi:MAG: aldo/keto reductase [Spirochaetaceae bacterium]|nr:MAG: aldo/keto reductase [Spirochaetaceae bacterium]
MNYRFLGTTGVKVSELCLGTMTFGREADEKESQAILDRYLDAGGNFLDTANVYGRSPGDTEKVVGKIIAGKRDRVVLATKVFGKMGNGPNEQGLSRLHILSEVENSLRRLKTDRIDLYYLHNWDHPTRIQEALRVTDDLVRSGKVLYLGVSNFAARHLMKSLCVAEQRGLSGICCLQAQYSLVERSVENELLPLCREEGLGFVAWGPLAGGFLSGKYAPGGKPNTDTRLAVSKDPQEASWKNKATEHNFTISAKVKEIAAGKGRTPAQIALAWLLSQAGLTAPILGARSKVQLEENLGAPEVALSQEEISDLNKVSATPLLYPYRMYERTVR